MSWLAVVCCPVLIWAQEAKEQPTPFSAWLDFSHLASENWPIEDLPPWVEKVTAELSAIEGNNNETIFRIRLRGLSSLDKQMQLRVFFDNLPGAVPKISGWSETGSLRFERGVLALGLGLPTSETLTFETAGLDMVEIHVPGTGTNVRGAFVALLKSQSLIRPLDFAPPSDFFDGFGQTPKLQLSNDDWTLFGRVKAALDGEPVKFSADQTSTVVWQFELKALPLLASMAFDILDADTEAPLEITVNDRPLGAVTVRWPDLADPAYVGIVRPLEPGMRFHYTGWLRAERMIPGSALKIGVNQVTLHLPSDSSSVAVRGVELQLKHQWKNLDYTLTPSLP